MATPSQSTTTSSDVIDKVLPPRHSMGSIFNRPFASNEPKSTVKPDSVGKLDYTPEEKAHLVLLGTTAGAPGIVFDAVRSGNIFDPAHMERAKAMEQEWEKGASALAPYIERQKKFEAEEKELIQMGKRMEGKPVTTSYAHLEFKVTNLGKPEPDWFLRIQVAECEYVDMTLGPYDDAIHDSLLLATRHVPRFQALLFCPESVLIFEHP